MTYYTHSWNRVYLLMSTKLHGCIWGMIQDILKVKRIKKVFQRMNISKI